MKIFFVVFLAFTFSFPAAAKEKLKKRTPASHSGYVAHTPIDVLCRRGKDSITFISSADKKSVARIDIVYRGKKYSFDQIGGIFTDGYATSDYPHNKYLAGNALNELLTVDYSNGEGFGALGTKPEDNAFATGLFLKEGNNTVLAPNSDDGIAPTTAFDCKKIKL